MKKTLLTTLLAAILVAGLFILTGCGEKKEENKSNSGNTASQNTNNGGKSAQEQGLEPIEFYVQNMLPNTTVKSICVAKAGSSDYTPNLLSGLELAPETRAKIGLGMTKDSTTFDFKAVDEEGTEALFSNVDLSSIFANKDGSVTLQMSEDGQLVAVAK